MLRGQGTSQWPIRRMGSRVLTRRSRAGPPLADGVLLVRPLGDVPWCTVDDLAAECRTLMRTVVANPSPSSRRTGELLLPTPAPYHCAPNHWIRSLGLTLAVDRVLAYVMWWRTLRRSLVDVGCTTIIVWDEFLALGLRLARPGGSKVVWVQAEHRRPGRR